MHIRLSTKVEQPLEQVYAQFDEQLFLALKPPLMPLKLLRMDGNEVGDEVHVKLLWSLLWISRITANRQEGDRWYFTDEGTVLPFFLRTWKHRHIMERLPEGGTMIVDDIEYTAPYKWLSYLLYPMMYMQFWMRKPVYRRVFMVTG